ncbi:MAG: hypothetical protein R3F61_29540 [Myxococcota bacterium]
MSHGEEGEPTSPAALPDELRSAIAGSELDLLLLDLQGPGLMLPLPAEPVMPGSSQRPPDAPRSIEDDPTVVDRPSSPARQQLHELRRDLGVDGTEPPPTSGMPGPRAAAPRPPTKRLRRSRPCPRSLRRPPPGRPSPKPRPLRRPTAHATWRPSSRPSSRLSRSPSLHHRARPSSAAT